MKNFSSIYVNPVIRPSVQGRHKQAYTVRSDNGELIQTTTTMNKTKEFGAHSEFNFPYNPNTNKLHTGLSEMIVNDFKGLEPSEIMSKYNLSTEWQEVLTHLVKQDKIKKQSLFEIMDGVIPEFYTDDVNGTIFTNRTKDFEKPTFLQSFKIILYDGPNYFEDTTQRGRLAMQLCKVHHKVANKKEDVNPGLHYFYISEENESEMESLRKHEVITEGMYHLYEVQQKFSDFRRYQLAIILKDYQSTPLIKGVAASPLSVKNALNNYVSTSSKHQISNINKFIFAMNEMKDKNGADRFYVKYLLQQALNVGTISVRDGFYIWHNMSDTENMYKHRDFEKLINFMLTEYRNFNPKDKEVTNFYKELVNELKLKGVKLEE